MKHKAKVRVNNWPFRMIMELNCYIYRDLEIYCQMSHKSKLHTSHLYTLIGVYDINDRDFVWFSGYIA